MIHQRPASLLRTGLLPVWLGFVLVAALPFLSILRLGPLPSFFLETLSVGGILLFVLMSVPVLYRRNRNYYPFAAASLLPPVSWYFLLLALFWFAQARLMDLSYPGANNMVAAIFIVFALCAWACRDWIRAEGRDSMVGVLAWVLFGAACVQALIGYLQFNGWASHFHGILMYRNGIVEGQLGQRNHFGHYLMWGVLSAAYLWQQKRLASPIAATGIVFLAAVMGLTGSRTVFAYVLALALLLPLWRTAAGKNGTRTALIFGFAALAVLALQFAIEPLVSLFRADTLASAAERMGNSSFGQSGRDYEWRKAWQIFLSAPWFGHGWGSYPLQGFLLDIYPNGFRPYETNVLFTHSHNSLLNLLAEMGIVGTALVLSGAAWAVWRTFASARRSDNAAMLLLLALMSVSLVHSLLEYPLWYVYFLSMFALFLALSTHTREHGYYHFSAPNNAFYAYLTAGLFTLYALTDLSRLSFVYQQLRVANLRADTPEQRQAKQQTLLRIAQSEPMLQYYAEFALLAHIDPQSAALPDWAYDTARRATHYRPFSNSHKWAFAAYRHGDTDSARQWLNALYRYYPDKITNQYGSIIAQTPYYSGLYADYARACRNYRSHNPRAPECLPATYR